jgi:hypothetical protein
MNNIQDKNCLDWVEAMLSRRYKHGKYELYNPFFHTHSCLGVALRVAKHPVIDGSEVFVPIYPVNDIRNVSSYWFEQRFGLKYPPGHYLTVNDMTKNYLAVCSLVANSCAPSERRTVLFNSLIAQFNNRWEL